MPEKGYRKYVGCSTDGCTNEHYAKTMCKNCYHRYRLKGTVEYRQKLDIPCVGEGCKKRAASRGMCKTHYARWWREERYGSGEGHWTSETASYQAAHYRLRVLKGKACNYQCVICGEQANDWALSNDAENLLYGQAATGREFITPYSMNPDDYLPMCRNDHRAYDAQGRGHTYAREVAA